MVFELLPYPLLVPTPLVPVSVQDEPLWQAKRFRGLLRICSWLMLIPAWVWMEASSMLSHPSREPPPPTLEEGHQAAAKGLASGWGMGGERRPVRSLHRGGGGCFGCGASVIHLSPHCPHLCPGKSSRWHLDLGQREARCVDGCPCMKVASYLSSSSLLHSEAVSQTCLPPSSPSSLPAPCPSQSLFLSHTFPVFVHLWATPSLRRR